MTNEEQEQLNDLVSALVRAAQSGDDYRVVVAASAFYDFALAAEQRGMARAAGRAPRGRDNVHEQGSWRYRPRWAYYHAV